MTVRITPDGETHIRIGDQYVQLAAAALVGTIRRRSVALRGILQALLVEQSEEAVTDLMRDVFADLAVLCAEVSAEEVRALSAAGVDSA